MPQLAGNLGAPLANDLTWTSGAADEAANDRELEYVESAQPFVFGLLEDAVSLGERYVFSILLLLHLLTQNLAIIAMARIQSLRSPNRRQHRFL